MKLQRIQNPDGIVRFALVAQTTEERLVLAQFRDIEPNEYVTGSDNDDEAPGCGNLLIMKSVRRNTERGDPEAPHLLRDASFLPYSLAQRRRWLSKRGIAILKLSQRDQDEYGGVFGEYTYRTHKKTKKRVRDREPNDQYETLEEAVNQAFECYYNREHRRQANVAKMLGQYNELTEWMRRHRKDVIEFKKQKAIEDAKLPKKAPREDNDD